MVGSLAILAILSATSPQEHALRLAEIKSLGDHVACVEACPALPAAAPTYEQRLAYETCLVPCGEAPRRWEKDGVYPVTRNDHELALLEYQQAQDPGSPIICYADADETIVVPGALCSGAVCQQLADCSAADCAADPSADLDCSDDPVLGPVCWWPETKRPAACPDVVCQAQPDYTEESCGDPDGDGLPTWLESYAPGFDPNAANDVCSDAKPCSFGHACTYVPELGTGICKPRSCGAECTAFHLEKVAEDDHEVIVHVFYDHTPVPARVLDLFLTYDHSALTLQDSRALATLRLRGKELATTHLSDGTLRLAVYDNDGTAPIPFGPIVELVFQRHTQSPTSVAFVTDDDRQTSAVAPLQGFPDIQAELADDALWGEDVAVSDAAELTTQLSVWYGFDSLTAPLTISTAPTAESVCEKVSACSLETDPVRKATFLSKLEALQAGSLRGGEAISGISGGAVYLDGAFDHLRLPIDWRDPLAPIAQSFSSSAWFYTEGNSTEELKTTPQVLFGHVGFDERTRFAILLRPEAGGTMRLTLLDGDLLQKTPAPKEVNVATGIAFRSWHHAGFAVDAALGRIDVYFDGKRVLTQAMKQPPALVACPQFYAATDVLLHSEGDVLGGKPPEDLFLGVQSSGLYSIRRFDPTGFAEHEVLGDGEFSYRDPDYNAPLDRIVFSANTSGSFEIWVSNGDGSNPTQLTLGFGHQALGYAARHPRWAPDGTGIVFESGAFDVLADDNGYARVKHIYYIPWDPAANAADIEAAGVAYEQLDYIGLVASQNIGDFRLTASEVDRHHTTAQWILGSDSGTKQRGVLLIDTFDPEGWTGHIIERLTIAEQAQLSTLTPVDGLASAGQEVRLLAAHRSEIAAVPQPIVTERVLYERSTSVMAPDSQFTATPTFTSANATVTVSHTPNSFGSPRYRLI